jgi:hypothetical protein
MGAENLAPPGFDPRTVQPVAIRYTDSAIPAHLHDEDRAKFTCTFCNGICAPEELGVTQRWGARTEGNTNKFHIENFEYISEI